MLELPHDDRMGIRYYAYAVEADAMEDAVESPSTFLSRDPLADAWGMHADDSGLSATFRQVVPECDMLYLDKSWRELQELTRTGGCDGEPRPSYRMFEGEVNMFGFAWEPWVGVLRPEKMRVVSRDLRRLCDELGVDASKGDGGRGREEPEAYVIHFLCKAYQFAAGLVASGRGMVYMIG